MDSRIKASHNLAFQTVAQATDPLLGPHRVQPFSLLCDPDYREGFHISSPSISSATIVAAKLSYRLHYKRADSFPKVHYKLTI